MVTCICSGECHHSANPCSADCHAVGNIWAQDVGIRCIEINPDPDKVFQCDRESGHSGAHVSYDDVNTNIIAWQNEDITYTGLSMANQ